MYFLKRLLTWWNSQTIGTQIFTARHGQKVGEELQAVAVVEKHPVASHHSLPQVDRHPALDLPPDL